IACTSCGKHLRLPDAAAGQLCRCPSCHGTFTVLENAGRLSVAPAGPDNIPEVLPVVRPASRRGAERGGERAAERPGEPAVAVPVAEAPAGTGPRPFVFRMVVLFDPEYRLAGELQARVSGTGLELRDRRDRLYQLDVGTKARWLGGNRLIVDFGTRELTLRIVQGKCQQAALARDLALFLGGQKPALRIDDYRPRRRILWLALLPLLVPVVLIWAQVGAGLGNFVW